MPIGIVNVFAPLSIMRIIIIALYVLVILTSYRWLFPRLPVWAKKLATFVLAAQVFVLAIATQAAHSYTYVLQLFDVIREHNVATAVAGMQLAVVAELALLAACCARGRALWTRFYLVGFSLLFIYLAHDELRLIHEYITNWELIYAAVGLAVAVATSFVAARSSAHTRIWYLCLLIGLAMSAFGALALDRLQDDAICGPLGLISDYSVDRCLLYLVEETMEFLGIWLVLVAMLGLLSDVAPKPNRCLRWLLYALPVASFVVCVAISDPDLEQVQRKIQASPADVTFESGVRLYGYQIEREPEGNNLQVSLWLSALPFGYNGLGYSIHLLDPISATSLASRDKFVSVSGSRVHGPWHLPVFRQAVQLETVPDFPRNHVFLVVLTVWRERADGFARQRIVSSDQQLLSDAQVIMSELVLPAESSAPAAAPIAIFENAMTLERADLPERVSAGETLAIPFAWRAQTDGTEDYVQFIHLGHEESGAHWGFDQYPLGTRLWYSGLADSETWVIPLPADLAPGRYAVFTGLYSAGDLERLAATDIDDAPFLEARVPLGYVVIEPAQVSTTR